MSNEQDTKNDKELAYYSALVSAWIDTKMECDRSLLSLSAAGLGLLVTLLTTVGAKEISELLLYAGAALCFAVTVLSCLTIFSHNARFLERVVHGKNDSDSLLSRLDLIKSGSFFLAVVLMTLHYCPVNFVRYSCKLNYSKGL